MDKLDELIRKAKPSVPALSESFPARVMSEIRRLELEPALAKRKKSRNPFLTIGSVLLLLIGLILVNQSIFEIQSNGSLELFSQGGAFILDAARYIPFDLIIVALTITLLASWMMWRSNTIKKGIATVLAGSVIISGFGGAAMAATDLNSTIKDRVVNDWRELPWISHFYKDRARFCIDHPNFRIGKIENITNNRVVIIDPSGQATDLAVPASMRVRKGQVISVTGESSDGVFIVRNGHHCDMNKVGKYFRHMSMEDMPMMRNHMKGGGMMMNR